MNKIDTSYIKNQSETSKHNNDKQPPLNTLRIDDTARQAMPSKTYQSKKKRSVSKDTTSASEKVDQVKAKAQPLKNSKTDKEMPLDGNYNCLESCQNLENDDILDENFQNRSDASDYNKMLGFFEYLHDTKNVLRIFEKMKTIGIQPTVGTYNTLIKLHVYNKDEQSIEQVLKEIEEDSQIKANSWTYYHILKFYTLNGDAGSAYRTLWETKANNMQSPNIKHLFEVMHTNLQPSAKAYAKALDHYASHGNIFKVYALIRIMKDNQLQLEPIILEPLVKLYINRQEFALAEHLIKYYGLNNLAKLLPSSQSVSVTQINLEKKSWPEQITHLNILQFYIKNNDAEMVNKLLNEMKKLNIVLHSHLYDSLISFYTDIDPATAQRLFNEMQTAGFQPNAKTYNCLIKIYVDRGDLDGTLSKIQEMHKCPFKPGLFAYNSLMILYIKRGEIEKAKEVHQNLLKNNIKRNRSTYDRLMQAGVDKNNFEMVEWAFQNMKADRIYPNTLTFVLITSLCKNLNKDPAKELFLLLNKYNFEVDNYIGALKGLIKGSIIRKDLFLAEALCKQFGIEYNPNIVIPTSIEKEIEDNEDSEIIEPVKVPSKSPSEQNIALANSISLPEIDNELKTVELQHLPGLIKLFANHKDFEGIDKVIEEMKKNKMTLSDGQTQVILKLYIQSHYHKGIKQVINDMKNGFCYNHLENFKEIIHFYVSCNNSTIVNQILTDLKECHLKPDYNLYNTLIHLYVQNQDTNRLYKILEEIRVRKLKLNHYTYNILLSMYGEMNNEENIKKILEEIKENGFKKDEISYKNLLIMYCKKNDEENINKILEEMKTNGFNPDNTTYSLLIQFFLRIGELVKAKRILSEIYDNNISIDFVTYANIIHLYVALGDIQGAYGVLTEMKANSVQPGAYHYNYLLKYYVDQRNVKGAYQLINEMRIENIELDRLCQLQLIDLHVFREEFDTAEAMMRRFNIKPNITRLLELDLHGLTLGSAYMMVRIWIEMHKEMHQISIITGQGHNSRNNEMYALKNYIKEQIAQHHPEYLSSDTKNPGMIIIEKVQFAEQPLKNTIPVSEELINHSFIPTSSKSSKNIDHEGIDKVIQEMKTGHKILDPELCKVVVDFYIKTGEEKGIEQLIMEMKNGLFTPNIDIFKEIIHYYVNQKNTIKVAQTLSDLKACHLMPDLFTYNRVIHLYVQNKNLKGIEKILNEMQECGLKKNLSTYNTLLPLYKEKSDEENINKLLEEMKVDGFKPDGCTYSILIHYYHKHNEVEKAKHYLSEIYANNIALNRKEYTTIINFYVSLGDIQEAYGALKEMKNKSMHPEPITYTVLLKYFVDKRDVKRAYQLFNEMQIEDVIPDEVILQTMIDLHVFRDEFDIAEALINKLGFKPNVNKSGLLDLHDQSLGTAYMMVRKWLEICNGKPQITIITGQGHHSTHDEMFVMKNYIMKQLAIYHPEYVVTDGQGPGTIKLIHLKVPTLVHDKKMPIDDIKMNQGLAQVDAIDMHVFKGELARAEELTKEVGIKPEITSDGSLDLQFLSHGIAYIMVRKWLEICKNKPKISINTGQGLHSLHTVKFDMKNFIMRQIAMHHPEYVFGHSEDPGELILIKMGKADGIPESDRNQFAKMLSFFENQSDTENYLRILKEIKKYGFIPAASAYSFLFSVYMKNNDVVRVNKLLEEFKKLNISLRLSDFNSLISFFAEKDPATAYRLFKEIQLAGFRHIRFAYNALIKIYVNEGNLEGALSHIEEMHKCKIKPNLFSYNGLIILYVKRGEGEKAMEVHQTLVNNHIKRNSKTYGWFIQYGLDKNNFEIVDWAFQNMKNDKIKPWTLVFVTITKLCKNLNKDPAREIFQLLTKYNFDINELSQPLKALINYCISCKDFTLAEALSKQFGFEYDPKTTIPRSADQDHAIDIGEEEVIDPSPYSVESTAVSDPISIESDGEMNQTSKTYTCEDLQKLLNLFVQRKDMKGVNKVLVEMKINKHALDEMAYNRLIPLYAGYGDLKGAYDLLIQMKEQNIPPNVVIYNSLLKYHVDNKDINRAYQLIKEMQKDKVIADQVTRDLMIDLHVFRQEISSAEQLIKEYAIDPLIKDNHLNLQNLSQGVSYMMVRQFLQNSLETNPIKIFLDAKWDTPYDELIALKKFILKQIEIYHPQYSMIQTAAPELILLNKQPSQRQVSANSSFAMSYDKYVSMIESCIQKTQSEQAYFALRDMRQRHFIPPKYLYDSLLNLYSNKKLEFYLKKEHLERAFTILKFMKEDNISINHKYYKWLIKKYISIKEHQKAHEILTYMQKEGIDTLDCCHLFKQV